MLTTSQQCNYSPDTTDACGTFPNYFNTGVVLLTTVTNIPSGAPRPFLDINIPYLTPQIDICKSINSTPRTIFNIKVESYLQCNGIPRSKLTGCVTTTTQNCTTSDRFNFSIAWNYYFKNKVTIRAISYFNNIGTGGYIYYAIYEGVADIEANQTTLSNSNWIINLTLKGVYQEKTNFNILTDLCNSF